MRKNIFIFFILLLIVNTAIAQLKITNNTEFDYDLVFIVPNNVPIKTNPGCFTITEKRVNKKDLKPRENIEVAYKFTKGVKYDLFLVDTSQMGTYEHTACLHSMNFDNERSVTVINDSLPRQFFYHCEETIMLENMVSLSLTIINKTKYRILGFSYAIDDLNKFTTNRYLVPWAPLLTNQPGKYYLTHTRQDGVEKNLKLKFKLELNGVYIEKVMAFKFTKEELDCVVTE
ncbi:hypothetical protein [Ferruginibacter profundus]